MNDDIVDRLRKWAAGAEERGREDVSDGLRAAADTIERLRAERDQARAEVVDRALGNTKDVPWDKNHPARERCMKYARNRGWHDLFAYINAIADGRTNENPKG
jgi:hypothetical protein